jgi:hypothetical protein
MSLEEAEASGRNILPGREPKSIAPVESADGDAQAPPSPSFPRPRPRCKCGAFLLRWSSPESRMISIEALARAVAGPLIARDPETKARLAGFREGLEKRGWTEGRNIRTDYRLGANRGPPSVLAKELVSLQLDAILTQGPVPTAALQRETRNIPIVFAGIGDPVGSGFHSDHPPSSLWNGLVM